MKESMTEATLTLDQEIAALRTQISEREKALRDTQAAIDKLMQAPHFRAKQIQEMEAQLKKKRDGLETVKEQCAEYTGTDLQVVFEREARQSEQAIRDYEQQIRETRKYDEECKKSEDLVRRHQTQAEQTIMHSITNLKARLRELEQQQDAKKRDEGEKAYREYEALYLDMIKTEENSKKAQQDILEALADYPEAQGRFFAKYNIPEPDTCELEDVQKIARAAIELFELLIEHSEELQGVMVAGNPIAETLALTDVEVLAHQYDGGIDLLQRKRAALLRFV